MKSLFFEQVPQERDATQEKTIQRIRAAEQNEA